MSLSGETEKDVSTLLRLVYDRVNWKRVGRKSDRYDVFSHKIKAASHQQNIPRFLEKLCCSLGVQSVQVDAELVKRLDAQREKVLNALRKETIYYMLLALEGN